MSIHKGAFCLLQDAEGTAIGVTFGETQAEATNHARHVAMHLDAQLIIFGMSHQLRDGKAQWAVSHRGELKLMTFQEIESAVGIMDFVEK